MELIPSTHDLTCAGMHFLLKRANCLHVAYEYGRYNSDILGIDRDKYLVEIEVKRTYSNMMQEFKKVKHQIFYQENMYNEYVPNRFYFMIPENIKDQALNIVNNTPYGLLIYYPSDYIKRHNSVYVEKKAQIINKEKLSDMFIGRFRSYAYRCMLRLYEDTYRCHP